MYRFNWEQISTDTLAAKCKSISNDQQGSIEIIKRNIGHILKSTGGLAIANTEWERAHQENVSFKLFHEALKHYLKEKFSFSTASPGYFIDNSNQLQSNAQIDPNNATEKSLEALPILGPTLSARIVKERKTNGGYQSLNDLEERIQGLGDEGAKKLEGIISIDIESRGQLSEEFEENLSRAFELFSISIGTNSLVRFLDDMATFLALNPHPASKWNVKRDDLENVSSNPIHKLNKVEKATILTDQNYYPFIIEEIKRAESSIDICMFFLSMGGNSHPNKKLLDLIIEKHKSGVNVRLILDKDREEDPYGSRIINSKSANYLKKEGIDVRFDQPYRLLHSKFVIFDSKRVVVGSHNWTKGSYFDYDDVSMCIEGEQLVSDFKARFKNLYGL